MTFSITLAVTPNEELETFSTRLCLVVEVAINLGCLVYSLYNINYDSIDRSSSGSCTGNPIAGDEKKRSHEPTWVGNTFSTRDFSRFNVSALSMCDIFILLLVHTRGGWGESVVGVSMTPMPKIMNSLTGCCVGVVSRIHID